MLGLATEGWSYEAAGRGIRITTPFNQAVQLQKPGTQEKSGWRADIQGLRAIAVLMVVVFHAGLPVPGGFVGVDVFFVISGFVITGMLQREWNASKRIRLGEFYLRRFKRLTPALALMVAITMIVSLFLLSPLGSQQTAAKTAVGAMALVANFVISHTTGGYFDLPAHTNPLLHTWSLSVEEQFYLVFPPLVVLSLRFTRGTGRDSASPKVVLAVIAIVSAGLTILGGLEGHQHFYSPLTRSWEFAVGGLLALSPNFRRIATTAAASGIGFLGIGLLAASSFLITESTVFPGVWTLLPVVGSLLLLAAGGQPSSPTSRFLSSRPMVAIGDWSYSIYLWHWPLIVFASTLWPSSRTATLLAAAFSFIPALISYNYLEQPIRKMNLATPGRTVGAVAATVVPPTLIALIVWSFPTLGWGPASATVRSWQTLVSERHAPTVNQCFSRGPFGPSYISACTWNGSAEGRPIYLAGDSDAWHFAEAAIDAGQALGRPVSVVTTSSCPLVEGLELRGGKSRFFPGGLIGPDEFSHCHEYVAATLAWLKQARPGTVFLAALDEYWWDDGVGMRMPDGSVSNSESEKLAELTAQLTSTVKLLQGAGHRVVLVQTIPTYRNPGPIWDPHTCTYADLMAQRCKREVPLRTIDEIQRPSRQAIVDVGKSTGAEILDFRDYFCTAEACSTEHGGLPQYLDATHLNVKASRALAPFFETAAG